ncbi:DUF6310 domain-containing protein [Myxococcus fulvus]|uniref:DUF6310 domain-containing protein n=1 Tax=Myxococcus fulvus TaxID=33 RepID=UPI0020BE5B9B|nr:DUF6310 domain-containing protein [Myxococcus fulvus]MCK8502930.1 DUF6310 domain-containing protein [Myxococcus fulvus]
MRLRAGIALFVFLAACASSTPHPNERGAGSPRLANLQRAATLPWTDKGHCVVREASQPWPLLMERCYQALDHDRLELHDLTGRCTVASAGAAALGIGLCVLAAPEIVAGAVIVLGAVVVAAAITEAMDAYEFRHTYPEEAGPSRQTEASSKGATARNRPKLKPESTGKDGQPPLPPMSAAGRASCEPVPVPHAGDDDAHDKCADSFPPNRYPGMDVLVGGARFDALQVGARKLWEIKTHRFDTYNSFVQEREVEKEIRQLDEERKAATKCGYDFLIGVSTQAHKDALLEADPFLKIVVTGCGR